MCNGETWSEPVLLTEPVGPNCDRWLPAPLADRTGAPTVETDRLAWAEWYSQCRSARCICGTFAELLCALVERDLPPGGPLR